VTLKQLPVPEGANRKDGEELFTRDHVVYLKACSCKVILYCFGPEVV